MLVGSGLAAKALDHSHATCRSGLALNHYAYQKRNSFSWKRRHSQSGSLENETIASIVDMSRSSSRALDLQLRRRRLPS